MTLIYSRIVLFLLFCFLAHVEAAGSNTSRPRRNDTTGQYHTIQHNQTVYKPLFNPPSNSTPRFVNLTQQNVNPLAQVAGALEQRALATQGDGTCAPGSPCVNGACCSKSGFCGYSPDFCGPDSCISNCDAKASCGKYAPPGKEKCPLNVCCSQYGFCGYTELFCGKGCDETGGTCGDPPAPKGKSGSLFRSIGYYESWANTRPCDKVAPDDLDLTGLTHLNFAFAFFHPTTFEMVAMDANANSLLTEFTSLRDKQPGLQTWISVGGWSFNDPGNSPDTRQAFSDMASTAENRAKFIQSLVAFMRNYGFDGADIDWEYPGADDRGGRPQDKANYVKLVKEMKEAFAGKYGLSVTLPASYWYLQHFDVAKMESYVSWFNIMTYDIHGVWDSSNKETGPYLRPHTNLTEIDEGLSLLWRAGVSAGNVVLGLGFYGRSFTLADPSCNKPGTGCIFKEGGKEGECTKASGILSAAEISRIIDKNKLKPQKDEKAAVKWITWDSNQWVSYDDEETFVAKTAYANDLGLSGTMVWAIDQGLSGTTNLEYIGSKLVINAAGFTTKDIEEAQLYLDAGESCYVSFCGEPCKPGYSADTQMKGEVGELGPGSACEKGEVQTLCCLSGSYLGKCRWYGYRGVGLSCYSGGCPAGDTLMTINSNSYAHIEEINFTEDHTCNGGSMSYCCRGFRPSKQLSRDPQLVYSQDIDSDPTSLSKRDFRSCAAQGIISGGTVLYLTGAAGPLGAATSLAGGSIVTVWCLLSESEASAKKLVGYSGPTTRGKAAQAAAIAAGNLVVSPTVSKPKAKPKAGTGAVKMYGRYQLVNYGNSPTCSTTYKCEYGLGFDQVCDNQRWALDTFLPTNVFTYDKGGGRAGRMKDQWSKKSEHHPDWSKSFSDRLNNAAGNRLRCEIDEFPLSSLRESIGGAQQALRALDGNENGKQGLDWQFWLQAVWEPCSSLLGYGPPVTWEVPTGTLPASDPRKTAAADKVIPKYGFDSASGLDPCYATFTDSNAVKTPIPDHGFRVFKNDPLFVDWLWPRQTYNEDPEKMKASDFPTSINSGKWKRDMVATQTADPVPTRRQRIQREAQPTGQTPYDSGLLQQRDVSGSTCEPRDHGVTSVPTATAT